MNGSEKALKRYLKQATRGLPRKQRNDLWQELEMDIQERVQLHRAFGMTEEEALKKTLASLGQPSAIQKGMHQVYTLPRVTRITTLTLMAGLVLLPGMRAVASVVANGQTKNTYLMVPFEQLVESLQAQEVQVQTDDNQLSVTLPSGKTFVQPITPYNRQAGLTEDFVLNNWLDTALRNGIAVKVSGWETLKFDLEGLTVEVQLPEGQQNFKSWYQEAVQNWLDFKTSGATSKPALKAQSTLNIQKPELAGKVVAVAAFQKGHAIYADVAVADEQGRLALKVPAGEYQMLQETPTSHSTRNNALVLLSFKGVYAAGGTKPFQVVSSSLKGQVRLKNQQALKVH